MLFFINLYLIITNESHLMIKNAILLVLYLGIFQLAYSQETAKTAHRKGTREEHEEHEENETPGQEFKNTRWYKQMQQPQADYFSIRKSFKRYLERHPQVEGPRESAEDWFRKNIYYLDNRGRVQAPPHCSGRTWSIIPAVMP